MATKFSTELDLEKGLEQRSRTTLAGLLSPEVAEAEEEKANSSSPQDIDGDDEGPFQSRSQSKVSEEGVEEVVEEVDSERNEPHRPVPKYNDGDKDAQESIIRAPEETEVAPHGLKEAKEILDRHDFEAALRDTHGVSIISTRADCVTINLAHLQLVHTKRLQKDLIEHALRFKYTRRSILSWEDLGEDMHNFVQALKDWDDIQKMALKGRENDPFIVTTDRTLDRVVLEEVRNNLGEGVRSIEQMSRDALDADMPSFDSLPPPRDMKNFKIFGGSRTVANRSSERQQLLKRVGMALPGGAFLIGPMLIMVLHKSLLTTLLTTSICVAVFGLVMAIFLEDPFDVLSGTAAYAAVLVVFVGTSGS